VDIVSVGLLIRHRNVREDTPYMMDFEVWVYIPQHYIGSSSFDLSMDLLFLRDMVQERNWHLHIDDQ
jgi:hypothetical protein